MSDAGYSTETVEAARELLEAHDALWAWQDRQPECDEDGIPYDPDRWLAWYEESKPRSVATREAFDRLVATGVAIPCYHPWWYRPIAESIVGTMEGGGRT